MQTKQKSGGLLKVSHTTAWRQRLYLIFGNIIDDVLADIRLVTKTSVVNNTNDNGRKEQLVDW